MISKLFMKDIIMIWKYFTLLLVLFLVALALPLFNPAANFAQLFVTVYFAMMPATIIAFDERSFWEKYVLCLPVSKKQIVQEKFLLSLICMAISTFISILFQVIGQVIHLGYIDLSLTFTSINAMTMGIFFLCMNLPLLLKFGSEKAAVFSMIILAGIGGLIMVTLSSGLDALGFQGMMELIESHGGPEAALHSIGSPNIPEYEQIPFGVYLGSSAILWLIMLAISYPLCQRIYAKREIR